MKKLLAALSLSVLLFSSCIDEGPPILPDVEGRPGDVTVVIDDEYWEKDLGQVIRDSFQIFVKGIASPEYRFDIDQVSKKRFADIHKRDRNLVVFQVNPDEQPGVVIRKDDLWAQNQLYILVSARSYKALLALTKEKIGSLRKHIDAKEMGRLQSYFERKHNAAVMRRLMNQHDLRILIPHDFKNVKVSNDTFTYVMRQSLRRKKVMLQSGGEHQGEYIIEEGIFVYERPYNDESDLSRDSVIAARNSFLRTHIRQNKAEGSYMRTTPDSLFNPYVRRVLFNGAPATEVHGHWGISDDEGNFYGKGGPFMSLSVLDESRNRIVTVEGFVHSPEFSLREYLRKVEAIIYSLEI